MTYEDALSAGAKDIPAKNSQPLSKISLQLNFYMMLNSS